MGEIRLLNFLPLLGAILTSCQEISWLRCSENQSLASKPSSLVALAMGLRSGLCHRHMHVDNSSTHEMDQKMQMLCGIEDWVVSFPRGPRFAVLCTRAQTMQTNRDPRGQDPCLT
jgi:hypothetical protein